ncbi:UDP-glucuronosyltransferase 2C1-like [Lytechinus variegatus]|uniref:UDP-glucuronosyltransferase 2C1-like n=1 Tax=Lytechinus variegatus TaxID=7654 RepID=UPI001BB2A1DE|nr:UDP-glucuronosyltransferase 2C1-like [Lytechinus variegatus]XP_041477571.1 UDP-glucuronosyltransferase 2C1-like [Lytechinus variegatus]
MATVPPRWVVLSSGLLLVVLIRGYVQAQNILINPMIGKGSHFYVSAAIGEELIHRGYNVTFLLGGAFYDQARNSRYGDMFHWEVFQHPIPRQTVHDMFANLTKLISDGGFQQEKKIMTELMTARVNDCTALLEDKYLIGRLRSANFSAVLYDATWVCGAMVGELLNLPTFVVYAFANPCLVTSSQGTHFHPAYVPSFMTPYSNQMKFNERVVNSLLYILGALIGHYYYAPYIGLTKRFNVSEPMLLMANSKLWLVNTDNVGEFPCALAPNVIPVGGLTTRSPEELPSDIDEFIQGSNDDGIIICSFGSFLILDQNSLRLIRVFSEAFDRLPQRVIWLLKEHPPFPIPANIKILPWLPQNDILGHRKTRALFFHGGQSSYYEAIYHGVPVVVMPVYGDQKDIGARVASKKLGLILDKDLLTAEILYDALHEVTTNITYTIRAKEMSLAFRDRKMKPAERASFWIDYAIKHGTHHLEIPLRSLNFFQYYLIDVILFVLLFLILTFYVLFKCLMLVRFFICNCHIKSKLD